MNALLFALLPSAAIALIVLVAVPRKDRASRDPAKVKAELDRWNQDGPEEAPTSLREERATDA